MLTSSARRAVVPAAAIVVATSGFAWSTPGSLSTVVLVAVAVAIGAAGSLLPIAAPRTSTRSRPVVVVIDPAGCTDDQVLATVASAGTPAVLVDTGDRFADLDGHVTRVTNDRDVEAAVRRQAAAADAAGVLVVSARVLVCRDSLEHAAALLGGQLHWVAGRRGSFNADAFAQESDSLDAARAAGVAVAAPDATVVIVDDFAWPVPLDSLTAGRGAGVDDELVLGGAADGPERFFAQRLPVAARTLRSARHAGPVGVAVIARLASGAALAIVSLAPAAMALTGDGLDGGAAMTVLWLLAALGVAFAAADGGAGWWATLMDVPVSVAAVAGSTGSLRPDRVLGAHAALLISSGAAGAITYLADPEGGATRAGAVIVAVAVAAFMAAAIVRVSSLRGRVRAGVRFPFDGPATFDGDPARVTNLSATGAAIELDRRGGDASPQEGSTGTLTVDGVGTVDVRVTRARGESGACRLGLSVTGGHGEQLAWTRHVLAATGLTGTERDGTSAGTGA